ncbi:charged multivesicular body protein [Gracilaria domingensis]|nr:charged multivesicular body protein [Gracilaria domingensis]
MGLFGKQPQIVNAPYVQPPRREPQGPSMDEAIHNSELRTTSLEARIRKVDADILNYKREMQRCRPGTSTHSMYKRRALQAMKQKKSLEQRAAMNANATFNLEQVRDVKYMQQDNMAMVQNLQAANQEMRKAQQHIDIDQIEELQDEMQDALSDANEIQEVLGRSYDVDYVDESALEAELNELEEDALNYAAGDSLSAPSYLQPVPPMAAASSTTVRPNYEPPQGMPAQRY